MTIIWGVGKNPRGVDPIRGVNESQMETVYICAYIRATNWVVNITFFSKQCWHWRFLKHHTYFLLVAITVFVYWTLFRVFLIPLYWIFSSSAYFAATSLKVLWSRLVCIT